MIRPILRHGITIRHLSAAAVSALVSGSVLVLVTASYAIGHFHDEIAQGTFTGTCERHDPGYACATCAQVIIFAACQKN